MPKDDGSIVAKDIIQNVQIGAANTTKCNFNLDLFAAALRLVNLQNPDIASPDAHFTTAFICRRTCLPGRLGAVFICVPI